MQNLSETVAFEAVAAEFSIPIQASGLRTTLIDICRDNAASPDALRRSLVRQLQATLPKNVPASVRADATRMPNDEFRKTEQRVIAATLEAAHASPTLRAVVSKDRVGREQTEFFGAKSSWMNAYKSPVMLTKTIDGAPVKLPVIL